MIEFNKTLERASEEKFIVGYVVRDGQAITQLLCKKCGTMIANRIQVDGAWMLKYLPLYTEITIKCDDDSNHVTNCCSECAKSLSPDDLNLFLAIDAADMMIDVGPSVDRTYYETIGSRKAKE